MSNKIKISDIQRMLTNGTLISIQGKNTSVAIGMIVYYFKERGWAIHIQDEEQNELLVEMPMQDAVAKDPR